ncbi:MOSC domain-containing protein [Deinococcus caeni]|uniref:MOSC domain-containing protein n=1 Tax=Deinococcus caeni TaxID=569127 RepID=UPI0031EEE0BB
MNVGQGLPVTVGARAVRSGIDKRPTLQPVGIGPHGLDGDRVLNTRHHGGPGQAAYLYTGDDYDWWAAQGVAVRDGLFGENLTLTGAGSSADWRVGDRLTTSGGVTLEVTAPRIPCATLSAHMGDPAFARRFAQAARPGLYARVLTPGTVQAGDPVTVTRAAPDDLRRLLAHPLAERSRTDLLKRLAKLEARGPEGTRP